MPSEASGARALSGGSGARFLARSRSFEPSKNFSEAPEALRARFFARADQFFARTSRSEGSRARFRRPKCLDFRRFSLRKDSFPRDPPTLTKHCVGARILSFELSRGETKTSKNRSASAFDSVVRAEHAQPRLQDRPQASRETPGHAFGRLPAVCGSPGASQDWPWSVIWASTSRPERIWTRPRHGRGRPGWSKIDFSSIFGRAGVDFHRFSIDFSSIFAPAACDEARIGSSKKSRAIHAARLGSCVVHSLRIAHASLEMPFERNVFSVFPLRTHKPT